MTSLRLDSLPPLTRPAVVVGFSGWPDAAEVGSGAVAFLIRVLGASRFASIDPEPYFVFGETRPSSLVLDAGGRVLSWPSSEFFAAHDPSGRDLLLFLGREPSVRWPDFVDTLLDLAESLDGSPLFTLGGTYDRVSHRGDARVSAWSPTMELRHVLARMEVPFSAYEGPTSIQTALVEGCRRRGLPCASLWGHAPHYVTGVPNPKVVHALLRRLAALLGLDVDLTALAAAGDELETQIEQALRGRDDLLDYVRRLDAGGAPDWEPGLSATPSPAEAPSTERIINDLETLLRRLDEDDEDDT